MLAIGCCEDTLGGIAAGITVSNVLKQSQKTAKQRGVKLTAFNVLCLHLDDAESNAANGVLDGLSYKHPSVKASSLQLQLDHECLVLDDEFAKITAAHVVVLDTNHTFETDSPSSKDVHLRNKMHDSGLVVAFKLDIKSGARFVGFVY